jgi:hypothetical protein
MAEQLLPARCFNAVSLMHNQRQPIPWQKCANPVPPRAMFLQNGSAASKQQAVRPDGGKQQTVRADSGRQPAAARADSSKQPAAARADSGKAQPVPSKDGNLPGANQSGGQQRNSPRAAEGQKTEAVKGDDAGGLPQRAPRKGRKAGKKGGDGQQPASQ